MNKYVLIYLYYFSVIFKENILIKGIYFTNYYYFIEINKNDK